MESPSHLPPLPEGWNRLEMNGRTFYMNRDTLRCQEEYPQPEHMVASAPAAATASAPPMAQVSASPVAGHSEAPFRYPHQLPQHQQQQQQQPTQMVHLHPQPHTVPLMQAQDLPFPNPQNRLEVLANAVQLRPGVYEPPTVASAQRPSYQPQQQPAVTTPEPQVTSITPPQTRTEVIDVRVPEPGVSPGQLLAFTTPARPGVESQQLRVTMAEGAVAGSLVRVQYTVNVPATEQRAPLPALSIDATQLADQKASNYSWLLYWVGWLLMCTCPPCCFLPWCVNAIWYHCCITPDIRSQREKQRKAAFASDFTIVAMICASIAGLLLCALLHHFPPGSFRHMAGHFHHGQQSHPMHWDNSALHI